MIETVLLVISETPLAISITTVVVMTIISSLTGSYVVNEYYTYPELSANNDIVGIKFGFFGEIFAVALGLALVGAYSLYMSVREISVSEVSALRSLYYSTTENIELEPNRGDYLMKMSVINYAKSVVYDEWALQARGEVSPKTTTALKEMFRYYIKYSDKNILNAAQVNFLNDVTRLRGMRASTASRTITQIVWVILVAGIFLSFLGPLFIGAQTLLVQTLISSLFSTFVLLNILALVHLAHPFTGEIAVTASAYRDFIDECERSTP